jgi:hypothetical protein
VNEQHAGDGPDIGHVPVAGEDDVDLGLAKHAEHVSCVEYLVSLPTGSWNRQQVVMAHEYAKVGRAGEPLMDPAVVLTADLTRV